MINCESLSGTDDVHHIVAVDPCRLDSSDAVHFLHTKQ